MGKRGFWDTYPQRYWVEVDWRAWEKAGRPSVPYSLRLKSEPPRSTDLPPAQPRHLAPSGFRLYPQPRRPRSAKAKAVDALLSKIGLRP
jgi:hypothetical protein